MNLKNETQNLLLALSKLCEQMGDREFQTSLDVLSENSIGKHVRHILEFYICLTEGYPAGVVDYDKRSRNLRLESDRSFALSEIDKIRTDLDGLVDKEMSLLVSYSGFSNKIETTSSFFRELVYNIEHATHHMAIIRIALKSFENEVHLPKSFGVAYSTLIHQESCAQ